MEEDKLNALYRRQQEITASTIVAYGKPLFS